MRKKKNPLDEMPGSVLELLTGFEEGDLLCLSGIENNLKNFCSGKETGALSALIKEILPFFSRISELDSQKEFTDLIYGVLHDSETDIPLPGLVAERFEQLFLKTKSSGIGKDNLVVDRGWFDTLIEDVELLRKFVSEIHEHLDLVQIALLDLEYDSNNQENINTVFRGFHTIKSSAAFLGVRNIEETAHFMENMLVLVRDSAIPVTPELVDVIFYGVSFMKELSDVFEKVNYEHGKIIDSFIAIDIRPIIRITKKIASEYRHKKIGEILKDFGKLDDTAINRILARQKKENRRFGEIALEEKVINESDIEEAVGEQKTGERKLSYVKVVYNRLNDLVDMVGELVVNQSMIREEVSLGRKIEERELQQLEQITTNIKNIVLSMGMVPVAEVFNKLRVVIRNASRDTGKIVNTHITGEDTELDRTLIEAILDPLVHIVRNAVDHGLEPTEERESLGKSHVGEIRISAEHKGSGIEIIVTDDGYGIDRKRIVEKAIERGLITRDESASCMDDDKLCFGLLFRPGFSTANKVTELSGRGVGLDVVRMNLDRIHGKVEIRSEYGKGTSFVLRLPLTLAIIDGFVTKVAEERYIFSFNLIREIIVPSEETVKVMEDGEVILYNRDTHIPVIFAEKMFTGQSVAKKPGEYVILIIEYESNLYGIAVDQVLGKHEIVIKSLNEVLREMNLFTGGTIFGDGTIGFVIDIDEFIKKAQS